MSNHPYNQHREQQVAHRRVDHILSGSPSGAKKHASGNAFSKITSKSAAERDGDISGRNASNRFARGGKVKHGKGKGNHTNVNIVVPQGAPHPPMMPPGGPPPGGPPMMPPRPPMAGPPPGGPPGAPMPPPGVPPGPGLPMRASGGRIKESGALSKGMIAKSAKRAAKNSYFTGGAITGVGREEKAARAKRK